MIRYGLRLTCAIAGCLLSAADAQAPCRCAAPHAPPVIGPALTCQAIGDPHYNNWYRERFGFYARGLYEQGRFSIDACGCEVIVQVLLVKLTSQAKNPANSGIGATAIRVGDTTFAITENGRLEAFGGNSATLPPASAASTTTIGPVVIHREMTRGKKGASVWAWRIVLPGAGSGSYLVYTVPTSSMPSGYMFFTWLTANSALLNGATGLCAGACPASHLPPLPFTSCGLSLRQADRCYPVDKCQALFSSAQLASLETTNGLPVSVRDCGPCTASGSILPTPIPLPSGSPPPPYPPDAARCQGGATPCVRVVTGSGRKDAGKLRVWLDAGNGYYQLPSWDGQFLHGTSVVDVCSAGLRFVRVQNGGVSGGSNEWVGSVLGATSASAPFEPLLSTDLQQGHDGAYPLRVHSSAGRPERHPTHRFCSNHNYCHFSVPVASCESPPPPSPLPPLPSPPPPSPSNPPPPSPGPPARPLVSCETAGGSTVSAATTFVQGAWYLPADPADVLVEMSAAPTALSDEELRRHCLSWCSTHALASCSVRAALLTGESLRCGFSHLALSPQCALFFGEDLNSLYTTGQPTHLHASTANCELALTEELTVCIATSSRGGACGGISGGIRGNCPGWNLTLAEESCRDAGLSESWYDMCVYDMCSSGGGVSVGGYVTGNGVEDAEVQNKPPSLPPPTLPPLPPPPESPPMPLPPSEWLDYYCTQCHGSVPLSRRMSESGMTTAAERERIEIRVFAYMEHGLTQKEANELVRKENEELITNGTGL